MASFLHKLNKNTQSLRTVTSLKTHLFPKPTPSVISHHSHLGHPKPECSENPVPHLGPSSFHNVETSNSFPIFPNFPFGYCMNPISSTGFEQLGAFEAVEVESDDARTIWADSVKKKRKKKMNKHNVLLVLSGFSELVVDALMSVETLMHLSMFKGLTTLRQHTVQWNITFNRSSIQSPVIGWTVL
ncbi:unnamed protein product, partial [Prunus brigantina]